VVAIFTAILTFNNSTLCPHSKFMCFVWISDQRANISLYSINWMVFINQKEWVYWAVRSNFFPWPASKARLAGFNLETNPHEIWGGKCGAVMDLCRMTKVFCVPPQSLKKIPPIPYSRPYPIQFIINWSCYRSLYNQSYLNHC